MLLVEEKIRLATLPVYSSSVMEARAGAESGTEAEAVGGCSYWLVLCFVLSYRSFFFYSNEVFMDFISRWQLPISPLFQVPLLPFLPHHLPFLSFSSEEGRPLMDINQPCHIKLL